MEIEATEEILKMVSKEKMERMVQTNRQHVRSSANLDIRFNSIAPIREFNYVQHA